MTVTQLVIQHFERAPQSSVADISEATGLHRFSVKKALDFLNTHQVLSFSRKATGEYAYRFSHHIVPDAQLIKALLASKPLLEREVIEAAGLTQSRTRTALKYLELKGLVNVSYQRYGQSQRRKLYALSYVEVV